MKFENISDFFKRLFSSTKEKPVCFRPNNDTYSLCKGADNPVEFAENVCIYCNSYENMREVYEDDMYD